MLFLEEDNKCAPCNIMLTKTKSVEHKLKRILWTFFIFLYYMLPFFFNKKRSSF